MKSAPIIPSDSEVRHTDWTLPCLEHFWDAIDAHATDDQFRKEWRTNRRPEYKVIREELYPLLWFMRNTGVDDEVTVRLMPVGDHWDARIRSQDDIAPNLQITLAYSRFSETNPGYDEALRMELLNDTGHAAAFGGVFRDKRTRKVHFDPCAVERSAHITAYADGITAALERKQNVLGGDGDLIVFVANWLALGEDEFETAISRATSEPVDVNFRRIHVVAGSKGLYRTFTCDREQKRLLPYASASA